MRKDQASIIARFAPAKALARRTPRLLLGAGLGVASFYFASVFVGSELFHHRSGLVAFLLISAFGVVGAGIVVQGLVDVFRGGPAVEVENAALRAFTGRFRELALADLTQAKAVGQGASSRVVVYDGDGPRLVVRADIMKPGAKTIAAVITQLAERASSED